MVYKSLNGAAPAYMRYMFTLATDVSQRSTRYVDPTRLYLPTGRHLKVFTDSFQYAAGEAWNRLPAEVRQADSASAFRSSYLRWYHSEG